MSESNPLQLQHRTELKTVVVIGAGGNIGSHLVPHLARLPGIGQVTLIDRDVYELSNVKGQNITRRDVGKSKAAVQARVLRRINPDIKVVAISDTVENVALGRLRADLILACLDSRRARQFVNQYAWRLGVPWIDSGVEGGGLLARVNVYVPELDSACLECSWDERDYSAIEQIYPCLGPTEQAAPTNASSSLGALAAALQAIECQKLLLGPVEQAAVGRQILVDAAYHKHYITAFRHNSRCRLSDHQPWKIEQLDRAALRLSLGEAFELAGLPHNANGRRLWIEGRRFVHRLTCVNCGGTSNLLRLQSSLLPRELICSGCSGALVAAGPGLVEKLEAQSLSREVLSRSLRSLGLRPGEVFSVGDQIEAVHYEIGCHG